MTTSDESDPAHFFEPGVSVIVHDGEGNLRGTIVRAYQDDDDYDVRIVHPGSKYNGWLIMCDGADLARAE
jgi:hypothetical protein